MKFKDWLCIIAQALVKKQLRSTIKKVKYSKIIDGNI